MGKLVVFDHPLIHHKLSIIRDELNEDHKDFVYNSDEIDHLSKEEIKEILIKMDKIEV